MADGRGSGFDWGQPVAEKKRPRGGEKIRQCRAWQTEEQRRGEPNGGEKFGGKLRRRGGGSAAARLNLANSGRRSSRGDGGFFR
jgi:hypothetical protein